MVQITEIFEEQEEAPPPVVQSKKPSLEEKEKKCGANLVPPKSPAPPEEKEKEVSFPMKIQEEDAAPTAFTFKYLNDVPFTPIHKKENQELLFKWGLQDDMKLVPFRYDQNFLPRDAQTFLDDFFSDKEVRKYLQYLTGMYFGGERTTASFSRLTATKTTLKFLKEPLQTAGIVGPSGHIRGRLHEDWEGIPIVDQLRECLLMEESELWDAFSEDSRKELLFKILTHLVIGGAQNQYEDYAEDYYRLSKEFYREFVSVRKNDLGEPEVAGSLVFKVEEFKKPCHLFPREHESNFCYVIADPLSRILWVWYFGYKPFW